ncbi:MAG TPA: chemotaxis protein CheB [Longimicrobiales bacterium]|nr:chemotaxis protein CheB [Longimicrobiales bacterium]
MSNDRDRESGDDDAIPHLTVVGIGASAGGLAALKTFISRVPADSGAAWVVVMHLSPTHESHLPELLQPHVGVPVQQVTETTALEPDQIYVMPPNANLNAIDTHLRLSELEEQAAQRGPVDHFFRTLARTHDGHSVGVILTGTGSDGAQGIREIKAKGGMTLVQDPEEAEYDGMPRSAIATGDVDVVLPVAEIPGAVVRFIGTEPQVPAGEDESTGAGNHQRLIQKVFALIRRRTGRDFSRYKRPTVLRRVARRMQLRQVEELEAYLELLDTDAAEVEALADDILITVTSFFRDPEVFEALAGEFVPRLFEGKGPEDTIRVWSVGCATGEEAYSLAILLFEEAARHSAPPRIQIFATDLHQPSLARARDAYYGDDIEAAMSPERLEQFFKAENGRYRVRKQVRELVLFSQHDVLGDPPFSKLDMVSCRNVLIYLERDVQRDVLALFHYSLSAEGLLVLGTSEAVDTSKLFRAVDKEHRIYRCRGVTPAEARIPVFPLKRTRHPVTVEEDRPRGGVAPGALHQRLVERYAPPSLLVSADDTVLHLSEHAGRYLDHPGGEPSVNVFRIIREELHTELRVALRAARQQGGQGRQGGPAVESKPVRLALDGEIGTVVLHVRPAPAIEAEGCALIIFDERAAPGSSAEPGPDAGPGDRMGDGEQVGELEAELVVAGRRLQTTIEDYEATQEELRAANEELESSNEELRATMEELETSKEELQSINEELQALNEENRHRVEELAQLSGDLQNLLVATDIAILFLDRHLRIVRFTPKLAQLFNVRPADLGRPISDLTNRLGYSDFMDDARTVLDQLTVVEREVQDEEGRWHLTRVLPYRTPDDRIEGVVVNFIDISDRKRMEEELRDAKTFAESVIETIHEPLLILTADLRVLSANPAFYEHFKVNPEGTIDRSVYELGNSQWDIPELRRLLEDVLPESEDINDFEIGHEFEEIGRRVMLVNARQIDHVKFVLVGIRDITERKLAELELLAAKEVAERADKVKGQFLSTMSHELRTPLNAVMGFAELVEMEVAGPTSPKQKAHLERIKKSAWHLVAMVDDILAFSRSESGRESVTMAKADLAQVGRDALATIEASMTDPGTELRLSGADSAVPATTDPAKVRQIIINLVGNAIKYAGGPVDVELETNREWADFHVRDRGPGIPADELERIFEPFVRLESSASGSTGGTGLGLAISRRFAWLLGGEVTVESVVGEGSSFTLRLPRHSPDPSEREAETAELTDSYPGRP